MELRDRRKLARIMVIQGVSQRQVAQAAGWKSHGHLGALLRGDKKTLTVEAAHRIAMFLGCPVDDLFVSRMSAQRGPRVPRTKSVA